MAEPRKSPPTANKVLIEPPSAVSAVGAESEALLGNVVMVLEVSGRDVLL